MKNITLSIDEELLREGRLYAQRHKTSLNSLIRQILRREVIPASKNWVAELMDAMGRSYGDSRGVKWTREDLYDV